MAGHLTKVLRLSDLDGANGFQIDGANVADRSGSVVASAGDVNGDGYADLLIGAYGVDANAYNSGAAYLLYGKAGGFGASFQLANLTAADGVRFDGHGVGDHAGASVSTAGDVNGDGFDDVIIAADRSQLYEKQPDVAYVVFGKASGFNADFALSHLDGTNGFEILAATPHPAAEMAVSGGGDINGDGYADLVIGSSVYTDGAAYVVFGKADGFAPKLNVSQLDGHNGFAIPAIVAFGNTGLAVSSIGDLNGDGFDDLMVSAPSVKTSADSYGAIYVVLGKASGFDASFDLTSLNGSNGFTIDDKQSRGMGAIAAAGDVNGDGVADIIVGMSGSGSGAGGAGVLFGSASGFTTEVDISTLNGSNGFEITGGQLHGSLGAQVSGAGDVNGDGFDDLLISEPYASHHGVTSGVTYVVFGKASGFDATLDVNTLHGADGYKITGEGRGAGWQLSLASAGDINDDGLSDIVIGASYIDSGWNGGTSFVIYGQGPRGPVDRTGTAASQNLVGGNFDDTLSGLAGDDRLHGNGRADTMSGGDGADSLIGGKGADLLTGGAGADHFIYLAAAESSGRSADIITDLTSADVIDLGGVDADAGAAGDQAFHLVSAFSGHAGELLVGYHTSGRYAGFTTIQGDTDGDGKADLTILASGAHDGFDGFVL